MPARLSRKRYTEITRYLKAVIADQGKSDRLRMAAVDSLLEVFARHDRSEAERVRRRNAEAAQSVPEAPVTPEAQETAQERAERFLARIKAQTQQEGVTSGN